MTAPTSTPAEPAPTSSSPPPAVRRKSNTGVIVAVVVVIIIIVAGVAIGYQQGWFGNNKSGTTSGCPQGVTLQGNGAQFVAPLMSQWAPAYASATGNQVNYPAAGSGTGITDFNGTTIDFAVTDEPLSATQTKFLPSPALTLPIVGGALAIIYNLPGITQQLNLSGTLIAEIYLGTITNWNDSAIRAANPGTTLPNATIFTVHRSDSAGTTYVLTNFLSQDSSTWNTSVGYGISVAFPTAPKQIAEKGNSAVLSYVEGNPDTIGYSDLTDVLNAGASAPAYAAIMNPAGNNISPYTSATGINSTISAINDKLATMTLPASSASWYGVNLVNAKGTGDYPLATFVYLFVYQALDKGFAPTLTKSQVLVQWLTWVLSTPAQGLANTPGGATPLYYVPLPSSVVTVDQAGIQSLTYNGAAVPSC
jgi:phosphate transport system substrate-binding protein